MPMLFTIIIPTYNRADFLVKTINSVLSQTYKNFELFIVDDGSTDTTEEVVSGITDLRVHYFKKVNEERGAARNFGMEKASGTYINFLDSDDLLYSNHLAVALDVINSNDRPEFIHLGYDVQTPNGVVINQVNNLPADVGKRLIKGNFLSCNGVFLRKDIIDYKFSEVRDLSGFEDWELWLRLVSRYKLCISNTITSSVINHDARSVLITNKRDLVNRQELLLESLLRDKIFTEVFGDRVNLLEASLQTYVALHLAIAKGYKIDALQYLAKGLLLNPRELFTRRFLAIIKNIIS
jgi:glycosyltransferase involved in cell wall biosynthesis